MTKRIISVLAVVLMLVMSVSVCFAQPSDDRAGSAIEDTDISNAQETLEAEDEDADLAAELAEAEEKAKKENAEKAAKGALYVSDVEFDDEFITVTVTNRADFDIIQVESYIEFEDEEYFFVQDIDMEALQSGEKVYVSGDSLDQYTGEIVPVKSLSIPFINGIKAGESKQVLCKYTVEEIDDNGKKADSEAEVKADSAPVVNFNFEYYDDMTVINVNDGYDVISYTVYDILNLDFEAVEKENEQYAEAISEASAANDSGEKISKSDAIVNFLKQTGFSMTNWKSLLMILIACILFYLAIVKKFEPLLLLPIAFGMLLTNLMGAEVFHEEIFAGGHVHWDMFGTNSEVTPGLIDVLYLGVKLGIYPCLIFIGVGAMTDFGPLIANPKSLLLGAAAQVGIFATYLGALALGFTGQEAASIGIIGGADGPTAIFVTSKLAPHLLGPIAVAAYSYMALVPVIQPPIMKLLTTKKERQIEMKALRTVSQKEKIIFPIVVTIFVALLVPSAAPLVGCLMLGNLLKECGVCERLSKTVQNELMNIVTVFLGVSVGATATASTFLSLETIKIIVMGVVAFGVATAGGVLLAKFMNLFLKNKINPLIGSAGVSAVPMAARVSQVVGQKENPSNFLLMHAMGPNVAGVIGSAIAAGALIAMLG